GVAERGEARADAGEDPRAHHDRVRPIAEVDHHLLGRSGHVPLPPGLSPDLSTSARTWRVTSSGVRPSVSTVWVESAYAAARAASTASLAPARSAADAAPSP